MVNWKQKTEDFKMQSYQNGKMLAFLIYYRRFKRKIYNKIFLGRNDIYIDPSSRVLGWKHIKVGKCFCTGKNFWLEAVTEYNEKNFFPHIIIGDNVSFSDFGHIGATHYIEIGNNVLFGSKCYITDHNHGIYDDQNISHPNIPPVKRDLTNDQIVIIEDNVWIGDGVTILPGVRIGKCSIVGTNAVVTKDIPSYTICVGIPAKPIKKWNFERNMWVKV